MGKSFHSSNSHVLVVSDHIITKLFPTHPERIVNLCLIISWNSIFLAVKRLTSLKTTHQPCGGAGGKVCRSKLLGFILLLVKNMLWPIFWVANHIALAEHQLPCWWHQIEKGRHLCAAVHTARLQPVMELKKSISTLMAWEPPSRPRLLCN